MVIAFLTTWMCDCIEVQLRSRTNHPGQLSLAIPLWVRGMSTGEGLLVITREKRQVLRDSRPCRTAGIHTGLACQLTESVYMYIANSEKVYSQWTSVKNLRCFT